MSRFGLSRAVSSNNRNTQFPLAVHSSGRYLIDQAGRPFRLQADAGWFAVLHSSNADVITYLDTLKARGFNAFNLMNIVSPDGGWEILNEPADYYNNQPFSPAGDIRSPQSAYFSRISWAIDQALARGIAILFFHSYIGYGGGVDGWLGSITARTNSECFDWGVYLATRFPQPNIIWMHGGDDFLSGTGLTRYQQIINGIQSVSRSRVAGSEWGSPDSIATDQTGFVFGTNPATSDLQLNSIYAQGPSMNGYAYSTVERAYSDSVIMPVFCQEPVYEDAWYAPDLDSREQIRRVHHWSITAGSHAGITVGVQNRWNWDVLNNPLGSFSSSPVSLDAEKAWTFYQGLPWHLLLPTGLSTGQAGRTLIVSGVGSNASRITSCITADGSCMLAYVPPTGTGTTTFSADLSGMAGSCSTRWWNPTSGVYQTAGTGSYTGTESSQSFTTPGNNGTGTNDWMLVVTL